MGDRGNIRVRYDNDQLPNWQPGDERCVYFYTHNRGSDIPVIVQTALARRWRWNDPPYLARIVFCDLIAGHEDRETGYGIDVAIGDNSHPVVTLNTARQRVEVDGFGFWTYEEFVALDIDQTFADF